MWEDGKTGVRQVCRERVCERGSRKWYAVFANIIRILE